MKRIFPLIAIILVAGLSLSAQSKPYNIVFDLTTGDTATHQRVIRWINSIRQEFPDAKVEVVFYGKALPMVETDLSSVSEEVKKLVKDKNVRFAVCEHAMQVHNVTKSMLLQGVQTVPDALYELISKQADGFGYIKVVPGGY